MCKRHQEAIHTKIQVNYSVNVGVPTTPTDTFEVLLVWSLQTNMEEK